MCEAGYIVGFSGNRPNAEPGRSAAELEAMRPSLERLLTDWDKRLKREGKRLELCLSAAEGADTIACEAAISCGIPIHLVLPKPVENFKEDFSKSPAEAWARVERVIAQASDGKTGSSFQVVTPLLSAPECYEKVNTEILEASDAMMILWNGRVTRKGGGAGEMLRQAKERELPYVLLNTLERENVEWVGFDPRESGSSLR